MYNCNIICLEGFCVQKINGYMYDNILSPILSNIYLNKLDLFIKKEIIIKLEKGKSSFINLAYVDSVKLKQEEHNLPGHLKNKIKKSRKKHIENLGIKRLIENENYVRIKYVRYMDSCIIGVSGSIGIALKIKTLIKSFLKSNLHISLNEEKTKIINIYSNKVLFLGFCIYYKNSLNFMHRHSREIENTKRVANKNKISRQKQAEKIKKRTQINLIKALDNKIIGFNVLEILKGLTFQSNYKTKINVLISILSLKFTGEEVSIIDDVVGDKNITSISTTVKPHIIKITKIEIMRRIHHILVYYNALSEDLSINSCEFPGPIVLFLNKKELTYCPKFFRLDETDLIHLVKKDQMNLKDAIYHNWMLVVKKLFETQEQLKPVDQITWMELPLFTIKQKYCYNRIKCNTLPFVTLDKKTIYNKLQFYGIINKKNNPSSKADIISLSDFNIITYFNTLANDLLSYYRCIDDFYKIKTIVN